MTEIVQGLFGVSPEQLQMQQDQALQARALQYAQMSPQEQATAAIYTGVSKLGSAVGGMLGGVDPLQVQASKIASVLQGADQTSAQGYMDLAKKFADIGLPQQSQMAVAKAQEMAKAKGALAAQEAETTLKFAQAAEIPGSIAYKAAQAKKINAELEGTIPTDKIKEAKALATTAAKEGTPEWDIAYKTALENVIHGKVNYGATAETVAKELYGKSFSSLSTTEAAAVNKLAQQREVAQRAAGATAIQVPLDKLMEKVYGQVDATKAAESWAKAGEAYNSAVPMIDKLSQMSTAMQNAYTGVGADAKLAFAKGLSAFGIPVDVNRLTNTEYANSVGSQLVQSIAHVFPGSQSNKELDQLLKSKPNVTQELPTILRLIRQVQDEMRASAKTYEQLAVLPEGERVKTNSNIVQGKNYAKLTRYRALEAQANSGKPMKAADIEEAKKLQQELGVQ